MDAKRRRPKGTRALGPLLAVAACLVCYANGLTGDFTYDDKAIVRDNGRIRAPAQVREILTTPYFGGPRGQGTGYRPVLLLSYAVQWWIHGENAIAFHAVNLGLHVLVTLLLLHLFRRIGLSEPVSVGGALLFAVHPIHVEAVTSLVGRGELLAGVFVLGFLLLALEIDRGRPRRGLALAGALACYALGLLTKESAAVAPALAFLVFWRLAEGGAGARLAAALARGWPLYAGCSVLLAGSLVLRRLVLGGWLKAPTFRIFELENPLAPLSSPERAAQAAAILFRYLGRLLVPVRLSADESAWSIPVARGLDPIGWAALALLAALLVASIARARGATFDPAFGFLFFAVAFAPTANVLFPTGTIFAERLAYLPSAGVALGLAAVAAGASRGPERARGQTAIILVIALAFAARTVARNRVWADDETLFAATVESSPSSAKAHYNYAWAAAQRGNLPAALEHYAIATRIYPKYFDAWAGKGTVEQRLGDLAAAEASFRESLRARPDYENGFFRLGRVREESGDLAGAERIYAQGLAKNPKSTPLAYRLAIMRTRLGRPSAESDWRHALALARGATPFRLGYAEFLISRGRSEEGRRQAREVLRRRPAEVAALALLADTSRARRRLFAEGLAVEKIFRVTRSPADFARLERIAVEDPAYGARFGVIEPSLSRLIPRRRSPAAPGGVGASGPRIRAGAPPASPRGGASGDRRGAPPG